MLEAFINLSQSISQRLDLVLICTSILITHYFRLKPAIKRPKPPAIKGVVSNEYKHENVIQLRPKRDGGVQGYPNEEIYMDNEGDLANDFYVEKQRRLAKVDTNNLKKIS